LFTGVYISAGSDEAVVYRTGGQQVLFQRGFLAPHQTSRGALGYE